MSGSEATCRGDLHVQQVRQAVDGVEVGRIGDGNRKAVVMLVDRHDAVLSGDVAGDRGDDVIGDLQLVEVDDFGAEMGGLGLGDVGRADDFVGQHQVHQAHPGGLPLRRASSATLSGETKPRSTRMSIR